MRYIVTGGAGMIGSALVKLLLEHGHEVIVIDDYSRGCKRNLGQAVSNPWLEIIVGDVAEQNVWEEVVDMLADDAMLDGIFHLAAVIGGVGKMYGCPYDQAKNAASDFRTFEAARDFDCPILYTSTACIYPTTLQENGFSGHLLTEDDAWPARPESLYGFLKLAGEGMAHALHEQYGVPTQVVRMFNAVGPEHCPPDEKHVIPALVGKLVANIDTYPVLEVWGDGSAERSFLDARDAAEALELVMKHGDGKPYNIGSPERISVHALALMVIDVAGSAAVTSFDTSKPAGVHTRAADCGRISKLGWDPRHTLREMIEWVWADANE